MNDLEIALKGLKKDKSSDALGYINELFRPEVIGSNLKEGLLKLMNNIKDQQIFPEQLEACNITSIFKNKGSKQEFDKYRGIFRVPIFRAILERLIYNDEYGEIDNNLTDANVGARKSRNIRDNLFVVNAILNSIKKGSEDSVDLCAYNVEKCFDALWSYECINDLYDAGMRNDKLALLFRMNENAQVAIKTSQGMTERFPIKKIIMQGTVWGSLFCTATMDKLPKMMYNTPDLLYKYKGEVSVPPLEMVDDILTVKKCGLEALEMNSKVNAFIELKKLKLAEKKCVQIHIGNKCGPCEKLLVHDVEMQSAQEVKYLGDMVHENGKPNSTVSSRIKRGYAIVSQILALLNDLPLGNLRIEVGLALRQAWLINGILFNCEVWNKTTKYQEEQLMSIDKYLLRGILSAHAKTPIEFIYLETGALPLSYVMSARRMIYLQTILKRHNEEIIRKVYECQKRNPSPGDWCEQLKEDFTNINMHIQDEHIAAMDSTVYKKLIKEAVRNKAYRDLEILKAGHSKVRENIYSGLLGPQVYLTDRSVTTQQRSVIFGLKSRTLRGIKHNFKTQYPENTLCPLCERFEDTQEHVGCCPVLLDIKPQEKPGPYQQIYGSVQQQKEFTNIYIQLLQLRDKLLEGGTDQSTSLPAIYAGPVRPQASTQ